MPLTEAKKRANAKYQSKTIASLACRVKKEQAEAFKAYCESAGETVPLFIERAVETQAQRDRSSLALGTNPATGGKRNGGTEE